MREIIVRSITVAGIGLLAACGDGPTPPGGAGPGGGVDGTATRSALRTLGDAETFFAELRGALIAQRGDDEGYGGDTGGSDDADGGADGATTGGEAAPTGDAPTSGNDGAAGGEGGGNGPDVTQTNVQERGVDEQDRVKVSADGSRLYVLHESHDEAVGPPPEPIIVEGEAGHHGGSARTTLRILGLDAQAVDATPLRDVVIDLGGRGAQGMYLHASEAGERVLLVSTGSGYWERWEDSAAFGGDSVVTRIDVGDPANAAISGSFRLDGQIVSSRRIGRHLFLASRFYPEIPGPGPYELSPEEWRERVAAADSQSLLPRYSSGEDGEDGETRALVDPASCFVAPRPQGQSWYSPDIVTLAVVDLETMALIDSECYLGASETLYASPNAVYLATTRWEHGHGGAADGGEVATAGDDELPSAPDGTDEPVGGAPYDPRIETDIHQFDIDGGALAYRGSGNVRGHLGWEELRKPFRMSERDGFLRVATVNETFGREDLSPINVTVLEPDGQGALKRVAELPNAEHPRFIGKPGEQLYASRFVGERAYLVTFLQTDPLYVVDLADPRSPRVIGELEIEGYSDYLLPIDETHLLGIGRDAISVDDAFGDGERGGFVQGIKLSLFDVSDPAAPNEIESLLVGERGTRSNALYDHRGITVQRATEEHPTRVSFGIDIAGTEFPAERPTPAEALNEYSWTQTGLYGFDVHGGDGADIESRGAMIVERAGGESGYYGPRHHGQDRAVMVDEATFYVHGPEVHAAPWSDLGNPVGPR